MTRLVLRREVVRFRREHAAAHGSAHERTLVCVEMHEDDGAIGYGEAAPLPDYDGVRVEAVEAGLRAWDGGEQLPSLPQAAAAIDLARWDLRARRAGLPVWRLLDGAVGDPIAVNATIAASDADEAGAQAAQARAAGFACVKLKVGFGDDLARVAAVRDAAGPGMAIRLDANGAWSVAEAIRALDTLGQFDLESCEEPVHGLAANAEVAAGSPVPITLDESAGLADALARRWCDGICLKISRGGGISGVLRAAARARELGYGVYLASTLDGPLGIAAALHAAAAIRPDRPCGLATLGLFEPEPVLRVEGGRMRLPERPGLLTV